MEDAIHPAAAAQPSLRRFRRPLWLLLPLLFLLSGPGNPVGLWLGWPEDESFLLSDWIGTVAIVTVPAAVMVFIALDRLFRLRRFRADALIGQVAIGYGVAVAFSPITMWLVVRLAGGDVPFSGAVAAVVFGWLFGFIPFFAVTIGLPTAIAAGAILWLGTVREGADP